MASLGLRHNLTYNAAPNAGNRAEIRQALTNFMTNGGNAFTNNDVDNFFAQLDAYPDDRVAMLADYNRALNQRGINIVYSNKDSWRKGTTSMGGSRNQELYKQKYLKYKQKYFNLKNI